MKRSTNEIPRQGDDSKTNRIQLGEDGKYRWIYELKLCKNPSIILVVFKVFFYIFLVAWLILSCRDLIIEKDISVFLDDTKHMLLFCLFWSVLIVVAYLIVAAIYKGKYIVLFEMDENGVLHRQLKEQVKKSKALGFLTAMSGMASGRMTTVGAGILAATKSSSYSSFDSVRKVKAYRRFHLIKVNEPFCKNQVYVSSEDFDFVLDYIRSHCPKVKQ